MKNKEDISLFFKGRNIAKEAIDVIEHKDGVKENLNDYFINNSFSDEVLDHLNDPENILSYDRKERFYEAEKLEHKMLKRARIRRIRNLTISFSSAAAIVAVSMLILSPVDKTTMTHSVAVTTQVTVPTLIINDSLKIVLDETKIVSEIAIAKDESSEIKYNTVIVPSKYTHTFMLPDSSEVTLNANSELRYPTNFNGEEREVFLKGEGYFEVRKKEIPFVVRTSEVSVKVYGTKFNVNTNGRDMIETLLVSGSVGVTVGGDNSDEQIIKPNELFSLNISTKKTTIEVVNCEIYLAWKNNMFVSENEALCSLLDKIALWYGVQFSYDREKIATIVIGYIQLNRSLDIENILKALEVMTNVKFIKEEKGKYVVE